MVIDIRALAEGRTVLEQRVSMSDWTDPVFVGRLTCRAEIDRIGNRIYLSVGYRGGVELECARCLERYTSMVQGSARVSIKEISGSDCTDGSSGSFDFIVDMEENPIVDIRSALYEEIATDLPMKPLCSVDCHGISLEERADSIPGFREKDRSASIDPRWDALRRLQDRKE